MTAVPDPYRVNSLLLSPGVNPVHGFVEWAPVRSLWNGFMLVGALLLGPSFFSWSALAVFLGLSAATLCAGHSVGFHRRLVHRSFKCPKWVERLLVWSGALVGMGGPLWTIRTHDTRDWAQRQPSCHDYLAHRHGLLKDGWWNLHCRLVLDHPPGFDPGPGIADDPFYRFLERTWMLHQIPLGRALPGRWPAVGGLGCLRARGSLHHNALVHFVLRPHSRPPKLARRWRRRAGP